MLRRLEEEKWRRRCLVLLGVTGELVSDMGDMGEMG